MIFRNRRGEEIDREQAEALLLADGMEVRSDTLVYDGQKIMVKSKLQPVCNDVDEPLYLTMVFGDQRLGLQELPTDSEQECRTLHGSLVDRYLLLESNRQDGVPVSLIKGCL